jgi:hypothetical protein
VIKSETEKTLKCKYLTIGIQSVRNATAQMVPAETGSTETISKSFRKYLSNIPGKNIIELLTIALSGTAPILS